MPSAPDWRSASAYAYLHELNAAEFAAEFLRRNSAYRRDYRAAINRLSHGQSTTLLNRWDLKFPFRPRRGCEIDQIGACRCEHLRFGCRTLLLRSFFSRLPPRNSVKRAASRPIDSCSGALQATASISSLKIALPLDSSPVPRPLHRLRQSYSVTVAPDASQCALRETIRATRAVPSPRE